MDARRRTLAQSAIPVPSSVPRPAQSLSSAGAMRASLAPGHPAMAGASGASNNMGASSSNTNAGRLSIAPSRAATSNGAAGRQSLAPAAHHAAEPPATVSRAQLYASAGAMSASRSANALRSSSIGGPLAQAMQQQQQQQQQQQEYAPPSARRSSAYRRQTFGVISSNQLLANAVVQPTRLTKDPRPDTRTAGFKAKASEEIADFLSSNGYPAEQRTLLHPTGKDFQGIFKFLIGFLEPAYKFGVQGRKFEDEVVPLLKMVCYPLTDSITKSQLQAVGSSHAWPNFLAMLHWLVLTIRDSRHAFADATELQVPPPLEEWIDTPGPNSQAYAWIDYLRCSYPKFLQSEDFNVDDELDLLHQRIGADEDNLAASVKEHEEQAEALKAEWQQLSTVSPLEDAQTKLGAVQRDINKFDDYLKAYRAKVERVKSQIADLGEEKVSSERTLAHKIAETKELSRRVDEQGLSPQEVEHMTSERQSLQQAIHATIQKQLAHQETNGGVQISHSKKVEATTRLCTEYEQKATALGLLPHAPQQFEHIDFSQELLPAVDSPTPDCVSEIRPALVQLKADEKAQRMRHDRLLVETEQKSTIALEIIAELRENCEDTETRVEADARALAEAREALAVELNGDQTNVDRVQDQVRHLEATMSHALQAQTRRLEQRRAELESVRQETDEVRARELKALEHALNEIVGYKHAAMEHIADLAHMANEAQIEAV